jgi:cyclic 2,3-diphosphoglycerate synthetase
VAEAVREVKDVPVVPVVLRPRPLEPLAGRRVAYFSTAQPDALPLLEHHLRDEHGADIVHVSGNLARRDALHDELEDVDAEVYLIEIKAAAIDVVAEAAAARGAQVVFADNDVVPLDGVDLDERLRELTAEKVVT